MKQTPQFVLDYLAAFRAANPGSEVPEVSYHGHGWYRLTQDGSVVQKWRRGQIEDATARLLARVAA